MSSSLSSARLGAGAVAIALVAGGLGYGLAHLKPTNPAAASAVEGRKILYWYDPMVPMERYPGPGKSSMNMALIPKYVDEAPGAAGVKIDPAAVQNLGVRLAIVQRGDVGQGLDATGVLEFNQRDVVIVQAKAAGFVQRVHGRAPGDVVAAGAPLADLLIPSWAGAQGEYLAVRRSSDRALEVAARQRLRLLGMSDGLIDEVAKTGRVRNVVTVSTPIGGAIQTLDVRAGMSVGLGQTLAQVSGLSSVWLNAAVPEALAGQVRVGQVARAELAAFPGEAFTGQVGAILPAAQAESRTLTVRIELANPGGRLRPGMFASVHLGGERRPALTVPSESVIRTGKRALVMVAGEGGRFSPVEVELGREDSGRTEIRAGLSEGQKVAASGQFLIDSEASLAGLQAKPLVAARAAPAAAKTFETRGRIEALAAGSITLSHEPVPAIGWPAMTMAFKLDPPTLAKGLKVGDRVVFGFEQTTDGAVVRHLAKEAAR
ncbi:MAG: efflux RND transporter periplasmic adaptor subunit [Pseudomonadota bacterium]